MREWDSTVSSASGTRQSNSSSTVLPYDSLEEIHIFVLANLLRRPIIIVCDSVLRSFTGSLMADNNLSGIYLPLLSSHQECIHYPLVVGYDYSHFVPLVNYENSHQSDETCAFESQKAQEPIQAIPLVDHLLHHLPTHFLTNEEASRVDELKELYLKLSYVHMELGETVENIPVATLSRINIFNDCDILKPFFCYLEKMYFKSLCQLPQKPLSPLDTSDFTMSHLQNLSLHEGSLCIHTYCTNRKVADSTNCPECIQQAIQDSTHSSNIDQHNSMTGVNCAYNNCAYIATYMYKPYCHEHSKECEKQKNRRTISTQCNQDNIQATMVDKQTSTTESTVEVQGLHLQKPGRLHVTDNLLCWRVGCGQVVSKPISGYCYQCYVLYHDLPEKFTQSTPPTSSCRLPCITRNCYGTARQDSNSGLCKDCKRRIGVRQSTSCAMQGCTRLRSNNSYGMCYYCLKQHTTSQPHPSSMRSKYRGKYCSSCLRTNHLSPSPASSCAVCHPYLHSTGNPGFPRNSKFSFQCEC